MVRVDKKFKGSFLLVYLLLPFVLAGCGKDKLNELGFNGSVDNIVNNTEECDNITEDEIANDNSIIIEDNNTEDKIIIKEKEENDLAGTCPRGGHCSTPGKCSLFIDKDSNELCDRGE